MQFLRRTLLLAAGLLLSLILFYYVQNSPQKTLLTTAMYFGALAAIIYSDYSFKIKGKAALTMLAFTFVCVFAYHILAKFCSSILIHLLENKIYLRAVGAAILLSSFFKFIVMPAISWKLTKKILSLWHHKNSSDIDIGGKK